ncbi:MAG: tRNA uridine-5-carboxymethylaminomethyl(34) synthesis enzyme MnmG [Pyramidobacter sp.]|nr:tRNA uridine-5-carboxymethylaminomethyl(34) synthesis enzyme MnmG [Pyramidobacter sp.]
MQIFPESRFDVIVVGGGHAGCEAALAAAKMGAKTLMIVQDVDHAAYMPCNPSIGGPAKGTLVREVSALGGVQARAADASAMMMRWLNTSKGPAVRALRAQCDLHDYHDYYLRELTSCPNLRVFQDQVEELWIENDRLKGVKTRFQLAFEAPRVILTTGTHLGGRVHVGLVNFASGPMGQQPAVNLSKSLSSLGIEMQRLKTGTTPRLYRDSIDWSGIEMQEGETTPVCFDLWGQKKIYREIACGMIRTNAETHRIITDNLERSPIVHGEITGTGPRYCPSIESKVMAFPEKDSHPIFLEPVARGSVEIYVQNFSTSLPFDVQIAMTRTLPGCKNAVILRPGYAIEYDAIDPQQLSLSLEMKKLPGLFCAGQINGTSGYEEAGSQGLLAGINAVLSLRGEEPLVLGRHQAYLGVLVDDLVTRGTKEPYRMLTSRCEHRLLMRHDNADRRLSPIGRRLGLLSDQQWDTLQRRWEAEDREVELLKNTHLSPSATAPILEREGREPLDRGISAAELLRRPEMSYEKIAPLLSGERLTGEAAANVETAVKYQGYIDRQQRSVEKMLRLENMKIPAGFDYGELTGMLAESREKLEKVRPATLGQAGRISGVTPTDLQHLAVYLSERQRREKKS